MHVIYSLSRASGIIQMPLAGLKNHIELIRLHCFDALVCNSQWNAYNILPIACPYNTEVWMQAICSKEISPPFMSTGIQFDRLNLHGQCEKSFSMKREMGGKGGISLEESKTNQRNEKQIKACLHFTQPSASPCPYIPFEESKLLLQNWI